MSLVTLNSSEVLICTDSYDDGIIRLWDAKIATVIVSFNGHHSAVTTLAFDESGTRLASGAKDTDIVLWDLVAEIGLFKLRGHKDQVTAIHFLQPKQQLEDGHTNGVASNGINSHDGFLLTVGKDALIKLWDLSTQHCIETHVAQTNGECWALGVSPDEHGCMTGGNDGEIKIWALDLPGLSDVGQQIIKPSDRKFLFDKGVLRRLGKDRTTGIHFHPTEDYVAIHGSDAAVEIWRVRSDTEIQKSLARKKKRKREKAAAGSDGAADSAGMNVNAKDQPEDKASADVADVFVLHVIVRTGGRIRSIDWARTGQRKMLHLIAATTNNLLEFYSVAGRDRSAKSKSEEPPEYSRTTAVDMPGHRTDIRSLALSTDDKILASAANGSMKVWNVRTGNCIRTVDCGYALCCSFLPGDNVIVLGTKSGELELYDVVSSATIESIKAHEGAIWTLQIHPDGRSMITGSADKSVKFWKFQIVQEEILGTKRSTPRLQLVHTRTLKANDDVLSVRFSPDSRLLALALLDNTVKVFFVDSLKLFLNLYGHKLPVLNMDISCDSKMIVTCSADKNVRLWGLDFGDCHKAFFAHQDSIMQVCFVPHNHNGNGHHFFSASKDRVIKYWDGDKFQQIQKLDGHHGEIWALAVSKSGDFIVSASHDKSIRVWEETDEQIFLEEERERELEELYESTLTASLEQEDGGNERREVAPAGKQTVETLITGERIAEALEIGMADLNVMREWTAARSRQTNIAPPARNPLFLALGNISAADYVLSVLQKVKAAALQDALLILPFSAVPALFTFLEIFASTERDVPLTCRILFFMLKTHHRQIVASKTMRPMLDGIRVHLRKALQRQKDEMGYNLAALKIVGEKVREKSVRDFVDVEEEQQQQQQQEGRKRAFVHVS